MGRRLRAFPPADRADHGASLGVDGGLGRGGRGPGAQPEQLRPVAGGRGIAAKSSETAAGPAEAVRRPQRQGRLRRHGGRDGRRGTILCARHHLDPHASPHRLQAPRARLPAGALGVRSGSVRGAPSFARGEMLRARGLSARPRVFCDLALPAQSARHPFLALLHRALPRQRLHARAQPGRVAVRRAVHLDGPDCLARLLDRDRRPRVLHHRRLAVIPRSRPRPLHRSGAATHRQGETSRLAPAGGVL